MKHNKDSYGRYKKKNKGITAKNIIKLAALACLFATVLIVALCLSNNLVRTNASSSSSDSVFYSSVTIKAGDSLWSIADEYMNEDMYIDKREYIADLKRINNLISDDINCGSNLIVICYE